MQVLSEHDRRIRQLLLLELILWNIQERDAMEHTIEIAGDHYTYRDKMRHHAMAISDLTQQHMYEVGYPAHKEIMHEFYKSQEGDDA